MPHYEIIPPLEQPLTWLLFVITWLSAVIAFLITVYFYRSRREAWWIVIGLAVILPLIFEMTMALSHGLAPFPYRLHYPPQHVPEPPELANIDKGWTHSQGIIETYVERMQWSFYPPLMAIGLTWAYIADRRKRALTAQT